MEHPKVATMSIERLLEILLDYSPTVFRGDLAGRTSVHVEVLRRFNELRVEVERLRDALHHVSLAEQNSMSSRAECGRIAREALRKDKEATDGK